MLLNEHLLFYADDFRLYYAFRNELDMYLRHHNFFKAIRTVAYGIKVTLWVAFRFPARRGKITQVYYRGFKDALFSRLGKNPSYIPGERQRS
jgi:hypothetical protein